MGRPVVFWELLSKEPDKATAFYEKIFGWKVQLMPELNYRLVETGGRHQRWHPETRSTRTVAGQHDTIH